MAWAMTILGMLLVVAQWFFAADVIATGAAILGVVLVGVEGGSRMIQRDREPGASGSPEPTG